MGVKVVDASALGAMVFGEPDAPAVAKELTGSVLVAPPTGLRTGYNTWSIQPMLSTGMGLGR